MRLSHSTQAHSTAPHCRLTSLVGEWLFTDAQSKVSSDWLPSYIKATRPVLEIFKIASYFPDSPRIFGYCLDQKCLPDWSGIEVGHLRGKDGNRLNNCRVFVNHINLLTYLYTKQILQALISELLLNRSESAVKVFCVPCGGKVNFTGFRHFSIAFSNYWYGACQNVTGRLWVPWKIGTVRAILCLWA